ncbi:hypothetical protein LY76DRAFT_510287, partial [Colletotrichum caudatum]
CAFAGVRTCLGGGCFVLVRPFLDASSDTSITLHPVGDPVSAAASSATVGTSPVVRDLQSPWSRARLLAVPCSRDVVPSKEQPRLFVSTA